MSHRRDCPTEWEARREGERAGERGYGYNPYDERSDRPCEEAADEWRRGRSDGEERREQEEREARAAERRAQERRDEERRQENYYYALEQSYEPFDQIDPNEPGGPG